MLEYIESELSRRPRLSPVATCQLSGSLLPFGPLLVDRCGPRTRRAFASQDKAAAILSHPAMKPAMGAAEKARKFIHDKRQGRCLDDPLWSTVNLFDRAVHRERKLAINEQALQRSQREQDGSEVRSVQPDRLDAASLAIARREGHVPSPGVGST
ncbi:hypothetical protein [Bradyrhizobium sp. CCBAU 21360]|uniref:hypothetical protein n=1 Tax=Bradyrhizobium sp. CCBAU 21360 TaxID=1325081 RepID=UPI002305A89B|nr:hypothetical protein [Bradyrhizobium sp. CCBAU 21360]